MRADDCHTVYFRAEEAELFKFKSKLHFWTFELLMVSVLIYVCTKISFFFEPIVIFISTLFFPVLISGFLFFIFNPVVRFLTGRRVPKGLAIIIIYLLAAGVLTLLSFIVGPALMKQISEFFKNLPVYITEVKQFIESLIASDQYKWVQNQKFVSLDKIEAGLLNYTADLPSNLSNGLSSIFSFVTNVTLTVVTVPFILFYMLKDGHRLPHATARFIPAEYQTEGLKILKDTGDTLSTYIQGQFLVCLFVGVATFIGYMIIGLPYAIVLGLIAAVTNIIPYVGPYIGAAPAVIVALLQSPTQAILAAIIIVIVQQIDGNIISPLVIGKKLNTHPLTIIILLLVAGNIAGILGMILAIPAYSVSKTIILNIVRFIKLRRRSAIEEI